MEWSLKKLLIYVRQNSINTKEAKNQDRDDKRQVFPIKEHHHIGNQEYQ